MNLTRREFSQTAAMTALAGIAASPIAFARRRENASAKQFFDWKPVSKGAKACFKGGGNALVAISAHEALLIDCKNPGLGDPLRREATNAVGSSAALTHVVLTHHHMDHSGGVPSFTHDLPVFAHANATARCTGQASQASDRASRMAEFLTNGGDPVPQQVLDEIQAFADRAGEIDVNAYAPTSTFEGERSLNSFMVGALEINLHHITNGHTDNDVFVHIPELNLIHTGDLLFHKLHPFIDKSAKASTRGWEKGCAAMIELCNNRTRVIPGHGEITDVAGIRGQIEYFQKLRDFVGAQREQGKSRDEISGMTPGFFKGMGLEQLGPRNLGTVFDELEQE